MLRTIIAHVEVVKVSKKSDYVINDDGTPNWTKKVEYFETVLNILDNKLGIHGNVIVKGKFDFGQIFKISVDFSSPIQVAESKDDIQLSDTSKQWP
jgi:hypothetical protein